MSELKLDLGSLNDALARSCAAENLLRSADQDFREYVASVSEGGNPLAFSVDAGATLNLLRSAGPVSDRYMLAADDRMLITGPGGSGKTTASVKKALIEAQRIWPGSDGVRRYTLGVWRQKYVNLWKATIPQWWKILPKDLPGSHWVGAPPRDATHLIVFEDAFGRIEMTVHFRAFGEVADVQDLKGNEFTDVWLNELDTLPEELFQGLADRVGRDPPPSVIRRTGRYFCDSNPPSMTSWVYRDFFERPKPGHRLYRQPGGRDPDAENIQPNGAMTREYYENSARANAHRPWWVRVMVDGKCGSLRVADPVHPKFDEFRNVSPVSLLPLRDYPVVVGVDGGLTPAAAYVQEGPGGQFRVLAEVQIERGGMRELAVEMLALEARRFPDCEFVTVCDPAMLAAEDQDELGNVMPLGEGRVSEGSDRQRLEKYLGRAVRPARTNELTARIEALNGKFDLTLDGGGPGVLISGPDCPGIKRGLGETYHFKQIQGTNDRGSVAKSFDSHVCEALQYAALESGTALARMRIADRLRMKRERREAARQAKRFDPRRRRRA